MSEQLKISKKSAIQLTKYVFLFLTVAVTPCFSQSTVKRDSVCICGTKNEIDSAMKLLNDYPDVAEQARLFEQVYSESKELTKAEHGIVIKALDLQEWDIKTVRSRIRKIKFKKWAWSAASLGIGTIIGFVIWRK